MERRIPMIAFAVTALTLTGCATSGDDGVPGEFGPVDLDDYSQVRAQLNFETGTVVLPLDAVRAVTPEVGNKVMRAMWAVTDECMAESGFPTVSDKVEWPAVAPNEDRSYGRWSETLASMYGVIPSPQTLEGFRVETVSQGVAYNDQLLVCWDEMQAILEPELAFVEGANIDYQVYIQAYQATLDSDEGQAAISRRTACMEAQDIVVDDDTHLPSSDYQTGANAEETETRVTIIAAQCGAETGAIQELYDITARYQTAYLEQREAQFTALDEKAAKVEARLDEVLADPTRIWSGRTTSGP